MGTTKMSSAKEYIYNILLSRYLYCVGVSVRAKSENDKSQISEANLGTLFSRFHRVLSNYYLKRSPAILWAFPNIITQVELFDMAIESPAEQLILLELFERLQTERSKVR